MRTFKRGNDEVDLDKYLGLINRAEFEKWLAQQGKQNGTKLNDKMRLETLRYFNTMYEWVNNGELTYTPNGFELARENTLGNYILKGNYNPYSLIATFFKQRLDSMDPYVDPDMIDWSDTALGDLFMKKYLSGDKNNFLEKDPYDDKALSRGTTNRKQYLYNNIKLYYDYLFDSHNGKFDSTFRNATDLQKADAEAALMRALLSMQREANDNTTAFNPQFDFANNTDNFGSEDYFALDAALGSRGWGDYLTDLKVAITPEAKRNADQWNRFAATIGDDYSTPQQTTKIDFTYSDDIANDKIYEKLFRSIASNGTLKLDFLEMLLNGFTNLNRQWYSTNRGLLDIHDSDARNSYMSALIRYMKDNEMLGTNSKYAPDEHFAWYWDENNPNQLVYKSKYLDDDYLARAYDNFMLSESGLTDKAAEIAGRVNAHKSKQTQSQKQGGIIKALPGVTLTGSFMEEKEDEDYDILGNLGKAAPDILDGARLLGSLLSNKKIHDEVAKSIRPTPIQYNSYSAPVMGANDILSTSAESEANTRFLGNKIARETSDYMKGTAAMLEANKQANNLNATTNLSVNSTIAERIKNLILQNNKSMEERTKAANAMAIDANKNEQVRALLAASHDKLDWTSINNFLKEIGTRTRTKVEAQDKESKEFMLQSRLADIEQDFKEKTKDMRLRVSKWKRAHLDEEVELQDWYQAYTNYLAAATQWKNNASLVAYSEIKGIPYKDKYKGMNYADYISPYLKAISLFKDGGRFSNLTMSLLYRAMNQ